MTAVMPSASNVFVKSHEASGKMVTDYARNPKDFALNQYAQIVPVDKTAGYYMVMTVEEAGRVLYSDGRNFVWYDGAAAPEGLDGLESHEYKEFNTIRRAFPFQLGDLTTKQATWDIIAQHASIKSRQAMTVRTQLTITAATDTSNYDSSHVLDVTSITNNTGNWAQSTSARQDIKRSLMEASEVILDDTLASVNLNDLVLVISSSLAKEIAQSQELVEYIKGSPDALAQLRGELPNRNKYYGLPDTLYGFPLVVEATRKVTSKKGGTTTRTQVLPKATPFLCARPNGLVGVADAPNFSTIVIFTQEEMSVETMRDTNNRRTQGRVVENYVVKVVAPASGVLFQNAA